MSEAASDSPAGPPDDSVPFGFRSVPAGEKTRLVRDLFGNVAGRYDLMNDLMSLGVHRLWKASFVDELRPRGGQRLLDLAGGTGDIALTALARAPDAQVTVCDLTAEMLERGRDRAIGQGRVAGVDWVAGDAERLPFPDRRFDACVIAFGLRNVARIDVALAEARRVLRPGGRFLCLEFSRVAAPGLDRLYDAYSFKILPLLGRFVARDQPAYDYLVESIRRFPDQEALAEMLGAAGFARVRWRNLSGGIAAVHSGVRL
jgi:demethylmenaquinone methyltransferase/2-methoxy-6-polyprenyl-1,4-benzoquinol methylase